MKAQTSTTDYMWRTVWQDREGNGEVKIEF